MTGSEGFDSLVGAVSKRLKPRVVDLGRKGAFKITHPGWSKAQAQKEGLSTRQWAEKHKGDEGVTGRRARSALGLMAMGK